MRLSPVLVAVFAASATLSFSNSAKGQTPETTAVETGLISDFSETIPTVEAQKSPAQLAFTPESVETYGDAFFTPVMGVNTPDVSGIVPPLPLEIPEATTFTWMPRLGTSAANPDLSASPETPKVKNPKLVLSQGVGTHQPGEKGPKAPSLLTPSGPQPAAPNPRTETLVSEGPPTDAAVKGQPSQETHAAAPITPTEDATVVDSAFQLSHFTLHPSIDLSQAHLDVSQNVSQSPLTTPPTDAAPQSPPASEATPAAPPGEPAPPTTPVPPPAAAEPEPQVLVGEVVIRGATPELEEEIYKVITTQPGRTTTRTQLQQDINAIFNTGWFKNVRAVPEDTPLGVRVAFDVQPNPVLRTVKISGNQVLPPAIVEESFRDQYGQTLNLKRFEQGVAKLNKWYQDNGYVLGQVIDAPQVADDGTVTLEVTEGIVENVEVRFVNKDGTNLDEEGKPIEGSTRTFIITREVQLKSGDVFNRDTAERDLRRVYGLGIFEDVRIALEPGKTDPRKANVIVNVVEKSTGSLAAGGGLSSASGLFGTVSYQEQNLGGNNQKLGAEVQLGQRTFLVDLSFTDPWIAGDPYRTSYTVNLFRRRTISIVFNAEGRQGIRLENGDRPRLVRTGGSISFTRPFAPDPFTRAEWTGSLGLEYQRVAVEDSDGDVRARSDRGHLLSFSDSGEDDLFTLQAGVVRDLRNSPLQPTSGSLLRFGVEQSIPLGSGNILFNRLRASYSYYLPVNFTKFYPEGPQALAFSLQAGTILGDLPPYEAFAVGGSNSVRGYSEGEVGVGRSFIQGTLEYRFPISSFLGGALFLDAGTVLGTQSSVPGNPGGVRGLPGSGVGVGLGVRIQSPVGPIRIDYGINDQGDSQLHFGIGERF